MLYVPHPCADIMCACLCDNFDGVLMFKTQITFMPTSTRYTMGLFEVRDNNSEDAAYTHECNVIQNQIYNKLQAWAVNQIVILSYALNMYILVNQ